MDSELDGGGRGLSPGKGPNPEDGLTSFFEKIFPQYLALGMSYDEFWYMDVGLTKAYREAQEIRFQMQNMSAWIQGAYFYNAITAVAPAVKSPFNKVRKFSPYAEKPYDFLGTTATKEQVEEKRAREDQVFVNYMNDWAKAFNNDLSKRAKNVDPQAKEVVLNGDG